MCLENPAGPTRRCGNLSIYQNRQCNCCTDCHEACWDEYSDMIDSGEADQEVIDFFRGAREE